MVYIVMNVDNEVIKVFSKREKFVNWWIQNYKDYIINNEDERIEIEERDYSIIEEALTRLYDNEGSQYWLGFPYWICSELE